jgi:hypothetical protein
MKLGFTLGPEGPRSMHLWLRLETHLIIIVNPWTNLHVGLGSHRGNRIDQGDIQMTQKLLIARSIAVLDQALGYGYLRPENRRL